MIFNEIIGDITILGTPLEGSYISIFEENNDDITILAEIIDDKTTLGPSWRDLILRYMRKEN